MSSATPSRDRFEFGFLRLLFASLVIFAHVPEQIDGDKSRELLSYLGGSITLGDLAVDGFFLVSGYLVTLSFLRSAGTGAYLLKRVLRIYPAFCVAYLICMAVVIPLAGGDPGTAAPQHWPSMLLDMVRLKMPEPHGSFAGVPVFLVNAPMWTIPYEFRCYLLVIVWGWLGLYRRRWLFAAITAALLLTQIGYRAGLHYPITSIPGIGEMYRMVRLAGLFMAGTCFYLFRDRIVLTTRGALGATAVLLVCLRIAPLAELGVAVAGGYLTFWAARAAPDAVKRLNTTNDISYGYYLYAFPFVQMFVLRGARPPLVPVILADLGFAALAGTLSWFAVERPFTLLKPRGDAGGCPTASPGRPGFVMGTAFRASAG